MPAQGKSVLPPPPGGRRAPPPLPAETEDAPPPLPSRPTPVKQVGISTPSRNEPLSPSASSDSSFQDEYEEPGTQVSAPPPLPPHPTTPKSTKQPTLAPQVPYQEEEYSELDGVGMVDHSSPADDEPVQEEYDEFEGIGDEGSEQETYEAPENQQDTYEEVPNVPKHPLPSSKVGMPLPPPPSSSIKTAAAPANTSLETYESVPAPSQPSVPARLPPSSGKTGVPLPPPPSDFEFNDKISSDTYEVLPDQRNTTPPPPPLIPSVPPQRRPIQSSSIPASEESVPEVPDRSRQEIPKNRAPSGMPMIGQDQLESVRKGLKSTGSKPSIDSNQPMEKTTQNDFRSTLERFKIKEQDVGQHTAESISEQSKAHPAILKPKPVMIVSSFTTPTSSGYKKATETKGVASPKSPTVENDEGWEQEEIYDDAVSKPQDPLTGQKWFKDVERKQANSLVQAKNKDGAFIVRKSTGKETDQPYSLVVLYKDHVYNLKIRHKKDGRYALGEEKSDELTFKDVPDLIHHHTKQAVMLVNSKEKKQYETTLTVFP